MQKWSRTEVKDNFKIDFFLLNFRVSQTFSKLTSGKVENEKICVRSH